jgi:hypothetical protein
MEKTQILIILFFTFFYSCKDNSRTLKTNNKITNLEKENTLEVETNNFQENIRYFTDTLVKDKNGIVENYLQTYKAESCGFWKHNKKELKENFEGIRIVKGIKTNKIKDTIFVIPQFYDCDIGESYCFFDKSLPRLLTDSECCQPDNLFIVEDIDEDGICEIGIYYSSCASTYKSLKIFSLKQKTWKEIGSSTFDVLTQDPTKVKFESLVKKQTKNKFKICNFEEGKTEWKTITMK